MSRKLQIGIEIAGAASSCRASIRRGRSHARESLGHRFVRFARRGSRDGARKAVRCIIIFSARQRAAPAVVMMVKTPRRMAIRGRWRSQIKIGDVTKTPISSVFLGHIENFTRNCAQKIILRAISAASARNAARAAPGGGAYTQN